MDDFRPVDHGTIPDQRVEIFGRPVALEWRTADPPEWIVDGLVARGILTCLSGKPGLKKSFLSLSLAMHIAALEGTDWLGTFRVRRTGKVGFLDGECGARRLARRVRELVMGGEFTADEADLALGNMVIHPVESFIERGAVIGHLDEWCEYHGLAALVLDPLRVFLPTTVADENANIQLGRVWDSILAVAKRRNLGAFVAAHDAKGGGAVRGAQAQQDAAEIIWHLTRDEKAKDDAPARLACLKGRDYIETPEIGVDVESGKPVAAGEGWLYPLRLIGCDPPSGTDGQADSQPHRHDVLGAIERIYLETGTGASLRDLARRLSIGRTAAGDAVSALLAETDPLIWRPKPGAPVLPIRTRQDFHHA